jgi:hypothetical protein
MRDFDAYMDKMSDKEIYYAIHSLVERVDDLEKMVEYLERKVDVLNGADPGDE